MLIQCWHAVWNNESGKYKKKFRRRIPEYEATNKDGAKRLNVLLPRRLVIKRHLTQPSYLEVPRVNVICYQETICMGYHQLQFGFSGKAGKLPRDPCKI